MEMEEYLKTYEEAIHVLDIWYEKEYEQAINSWGSLYAKDNQAFIGYQPLHNFIKDRQSESVEHGYFEKDLGFLANAFKEGSLESSSAYSSFSKLLFQIGLSPQYWFDFKGLDKALKHWQAESNKTTLIPFAVFMLGLINAYLGKYKESLELLIKARDNMTNSKQQAAKIEPLISLVKSIIGDSLRPKKKKSIHTKQSWIDAGFSEEDLETWIYAEIEPSVALDWKKGNFNAKDASRWHKADYDLEEAKVWSKYFSPQEAIQCRIAGFKEAEKASRWMKIFNFPSEAMRWQKEGFSTKEAAVWVKQSITDPLEAKRRKEAMH